MILLGHTTMTHGIHGELKFYPNLIEFPFSNLEFEVIIHNEVHKITKFIKHQNHYLITIDHLNDINLVENYRNQNIYIEKENLKLKNSYYIEELLGYCVYEGQDYLGKITDIRYNKSGVYFDIENHYIFPYQEYFIVNITKDKIIVKNVKGLRL